MSACRAAVTVTIVAVVLGSVSASAEAATRAEYIAQVDPICETTNMAMKRAQRGSVRDLRNGRHRKAGHKVARAARIFQDGISETAAVSQPDADAALLSEWIAGLQRQAKLMLDVAKAVKASPLRQPRLRRSQRRWQRQVDANAELIAGFGFQSCG